MSQPALELHALTIRYGQVEAIQRFDLSVAPGETVALLGPSGSGKTTLLYAVAGFVDPTEGEILMTGRLVADPSRSTPPEDRSVGVVFQHYALWPHLDALDTVAYPLRRRGLDRSAARHQAMVLLEQLGIARLANRRPAELSGGQQQRVGLARALACEAGLYLFDEPTAHLDAPLRAVVQEEIAERRHQSGAAAIHATHDAAEALAIADRLVLIREGTVVQAGSPLEVYERPADRWAAVLTGPTSLLRAPVLDAADGQLTVDIGGTKAVVRSEGGSARGALALLVRPEWARLGGELPGRVHQVWFRGSHTDYGLATPVGEIQVRALGRPLLGVGDSSPWSLDRVWPLEAAD